MTTETGKTVAIAGGAVLLAVLIGVVGDWPTWLTLAVASVAATGAGLLAHDHGQKIRRRLAEERRFAAARAEHSTPSPPAPEPQPLTATYEITAVRVPSSLPDIPFALSCVVTWQFRPGAHTGHANPGALAAEAVLHRARRLTAQHHPEDSAAVHALAAALGHPVPDGTNSLIAWATEVGLMIGEEHREHLRELTALRRQRALTELSMDNERHVRSYLGEEVLTTVGSAVVWWLAQDRTKIRETADLIGTLARVSAAANGADVDPLPHQPLEHPGPIAPDGGMVVESTVTERTGPDDLLPDPHDDENALFGHSLASTFDNHGHPDRAARARELYNVDHAGPGPETRNGLPEDHPE